MANETITATLGLDISRYTQGLDRANQQAGKFKQRLESIIGPGILRGAGIGFLGYTLANGILNASRHAAKLADEMERAGKAGSETYRRAGSIATFFEEAAQALRNQAIVELDWWARQGEAFARAHLVMLFGEARIQENETSEALARIAERRLAEARALHDERMKLKDAEIAKEKELADRQRRVDEFDLRTAQMLEDAEFERLSTKDKMLRLEEKAADLFNEFTRAEGDALRQAELRNEAAKIYARYSDLTAQYAEEEADARERAAEATGKQMVAAKETAKATKDMVSALKDGVAVAVADSKEKKQAVAGLQGQASGVMSGAMRQMAQVGRVQGGNLTLQDYATSNSSYYRRQFNRETAELERARQAEMRGNDPLAARIREESARRQERNLPGVARSNEAERQRIAEDAKAQVEQLKAAVKALDEIKTNTAALKE